MLPAEVFSSLLERTVSSTKTVGNIHFLPLVVSEMLFSKAHIMSPSMWCGFRMRAERWVILNWFSSSRKLLSPDSIVKGICLGRCSSRRPACVQTNNMYWTEITSSSHEVCLAVPKHMSRGKPSAATHLCFCDLMNIIPQWQELPQSDTAFTPCIRVVEAP